MDHERPTGNPFVDPILGRYEFKNDSSNKFYEVMYCGIDLSGDPIIQISWGKIGAKKPQGMRQVSVLEAENKVREKKRKGYVYIQGSCKSVAQKYHEGLTQVATKIRGSLEEDEATQRPRM